MNEPETPSDDSLDEYLLPRIDVPRAEKLRREVFGQIHRGARRRRIARRAGWTAAFVGCYLAGIATMQALWHLRAEAPPIVKTEPAETAPPAMSPTTTPPVSARPTVIAAGRARTPKKTQSRFEVLRAAGDRSLHERRDLRSAIRFYGQAVKEASPQELEISRKLDSWLLMSLKQARLQEVGIENHSG